MGNSRMQPQGKAKSEIYLDFFSLKEAPFSMTPDPEFLFLSSTHQNVIDKILYGIHIRTGFILLTGEVGTGKTTICRSILDKLNEEADTVYIINPLLRGKELIVNILKDLAIDCSPSSSKMSLISRLNNFLLSRESSVPTVIIIDDAQTMPLATLEDLRLLSNLETDKEKLLQIVLVGQPELFDILSRPEMRQLSQRVGIKCQLEYLRKEEVEGYISRRLLIAGNDGRIRFTGGAVRKVYKASKGTPRTINKICNFALIAGYVENEFTIRPEHVRKAISEVGDIDTKNSRIKKGYVNKQEVSENKLTLILATTLMILVAILCLSLFLQSPSIIHNKIASFHPAEEKKSVIKRNGPPMPILTSEIQPVTSDEDDAESISFQVSEAELAPSQVTEEEAIPSPFTVVLGSFLTLGRTKKAATEYKERGLEVSWNRVDLGKKGIWYRLFSGKFISKSEAERFKERNKLNNSIVICAPWAVQIGRDISLGDLERINKILKDNSLDSYLKVSNKDKHRDRLLTGAFITKEGADNQARELNDHGIEAIVVTR